MNEIFNSDPKEIDRELANLDLNTQIECMQSATPDNLRKCLSADAPPQLVDRFAHLAYRVGLYTHPKRRKELDLPPAFTTFEIGRIFKGLSMENEASTKFFQASNEGDLRADGEVASFIDDEMRKIFYLHNTIRNGYDSVMIRLRLMAIYRELGLIANADASLEKAKAMCDHEGTRHLINALRIYTGTNIDEVMQCYELAAEKGDTTMLIPLLRHLLNKSPLDRPYDRIIKILRDGIKFGQTSLYLTLGRMLALYDNLEDAKIAFERGLRVGHLEALDPLLAIENLKDPGIESNNHTSVFYRAFDHETLGRLLGDNDFEGIPLL